MATASAAGQYTQVTLVVQEPRKFARHGNSAQHKKAERLWHIKQLKKKDKRRAMAEAAVPKSRGGVGYGHVIKVLELFENTLSLRSFPGMHPQSA